MESEAGVDPASAAVHHGAYRARTRWSWHSAILATVGIVVTAILLAQAVVDVVVTLGGNLQHFQIATTLLISQVTAILFTWLAAGWTSSDRRAALALDPPVQGPRAYVIGFVTMLVLFGSLSALIWLFQRDAVTDDLAVYAELIRSPAGGLAILAIAAGAPLMEELLFRGFLFSALARSAIGFNGAAVTTSAVWTAMHMGYSLVGLVEVFSVGLYFAWLLWWTGSLRVPLFCHAAYNLSVVVVLVTVDIPQAAGA